MKKKRYIVGAIVTFLLLLSVLCSSMSLSFFTDHDSLQTNIATEFLNTKINARIDDTIQTTTSDDFVIKTVDVRQYNNGNVAVQSGLNVNLSFDNKTALNNVYLYDATMDDSSIKADVLNNGAIHALNATISDDKINYTMDKVDVKKNTEKNQKFKVVIANKVNDTLNIVLKFDIAESSGYGFKEDLFAHLFIKCEG